jgi:hypothetical protein
MTKIRFCPSGKLAFSTEEEAMAEVRRIQIRAARWNSQAGRKPPTHAYRCRRCRFFHMTSRRPK